MTEQPKMITAAEYAARHGHSYQRTRVWCNAGRIKGAVYQGEGSRGLWMIPEDAVWPGRSAPGRPKIEIKGRG